MSNLMKKRVTNLMTVLGIAFIMAMSSSPIFAQQKSPFVDVKTCNDTEYQTVKSSKDFVSKQYKDGSVVIIEMVDQYLFPSGIDETGKNVIIQTFGTTEESYHWSQATGLTSFPGKGTQTTSQGIVAGDFLNTNFPGGGSIETAGTYNLSDQEWTFLGMNPEFPELSSESYNSAWGQSDDGSKVVGMQMHDGWSATAFKWTAEGGYENIGNSLAYDSRASGISRNGEVVYGWTSHEFGYWMPIIWHDDTYTMLNGEEAGEVMAASPEGTYVVGIADDNAFAWSETLGYVSFGTYQDYPTIVMEDGSVFGFTGVFPPPIRRAFYRGPDGNMGTFNDYAEARGMENAQAWTFYSVNDATPDGNVFIGSGINPDGIDVSFVIDFDVTAAQEYTLSLSVEPQEGGEVSGGGVYEEGVVVSIDAEANEGYEFVSWTSEDGTVVSTEASTSINMPANDYHLIANFEMEVVYYTLTLEMDPDNAANLMGAGSYQAGEEVNISAEVIGYYAFDNWTNEIGDVVSSDANTIVIMPEEDLILTANLHSTVGITGLSSSEFKVYPNPAKESITIEGLGEQVSNIRITNAMGQIVLFSEIKSEMQTIDVSELSSGIYMIQISDESRMIDNKRLLIN